MEKEKSENVKCGLVDEFDVQEAVDLLKKYVKIVQNNSSRDVISECVSELDKTEHLKKFANEFRELDQNISVKDLARKLSDLAGKPTMEELKPAVRYLKDLSEKVAGLNLDMADKMSGPEKIGMAAVLNKLMLDGKLTESDFDGIVLCGFPKDSIQMWKEMYRPANERKKRELSVGSFRRLEQPIVVEENSSTEDVELGSSEKANAILDEVKETSVPIGWKRSSINQKIVNPAPVIVQKQFKDFCENFENVQALVNATPAKSIKILPTLRMFLDQLIKLVEENSDYNWGDCVLKYGKWLSDYEQGLSPTVVEHAKFTGKCCACEMKCRCEHKCSDKNEPVRTKIVYDAERKVHTDGKDGPIVQMPKATVQCTDCGSPERDMTELKAVASVEQAEQPKEISLRETKVIPNKIKSELDENGLEKRSYYKDGQFVRSVDAFGDVSDKPKNPVVARNIEEIAKEQRETSPLWKSLEDVSKSPFLTGDLKEAAKTLQKYSKILEDGKPFDAKDDQSDSLKQKQDRIKKYRTKTEDEWKNSINNTERILEKKNKPEELSVYEQLVKARQDKSVSELNQDKTFGEVSGNDLEQAAKILQKYAEIVEDNISYQEDNFTATPVDVKRTDGPFRRSVKPLWESDPGLAKKETKQSLTEMMKSFLKVSKKEKLSEPMFNLSLWQKTKVYFRDLKNKASTLFRSPEITEEEVDRAIRLMEKQIAEIKKSKNPTPEMYAHLFDNLLPKKDQTYFPKQEMVIPDAKHTVVKVKSSNKIVFDEKSKEQLSEYKGVVRCCNSDSLFIDDELRNEEDFYLTESKLYNLHNKLMHNFNCFCEKEQYPHLRNLHNKIEKYHSRISFKEETPKFKEFIDVYSDFLLEVELLIK